LERRNCEFSADDRLQIIDIYQRFEQTEQSKIFRNEEFGYWELTIDRPLRNEAGEIVCDKKGKIKVDSKLRDKEQIPMTYEGGMEAFFEQEVKPYVPDAIPDYDNAIIGYELSFTKYFYKPVELRPIEDIRADIEAMECDTDGLLDLILNVR
jgi:type I restriction enzyme M protein